MVAQGEVGGGLPPGLSLFEKPPDLIGSPQARQVSGGFRGRIVDDGRRSQLLAVDERCGGARRPGGEEPLEVGLQAVAAVCRQHRRQQIQGFEDLVGTRDDFEGVQVHPARTSLGVLQQRFDASQQHRLRAMQPEDGRGRSGSRPVPGSGQGLRVVLATGKFEPLQGLGRLLRSHRAACRTGDVGGRKEAQLQRARQTRQRGDDFPGGGRQRAGRIDHQRQPLRRLHELFLVALDDHPAGASAGIVAPDGAQQRIPGNVDPGRPAAQFFVVDLAAQGVAGIAYPFRAQGLGAAQRRVRFEPDGMEKLWPDVEIALAKSRQLQSGQLAIADPQRHGDAQADLHLASVGRDGEHLDHHPVLAGGGDQHRVLAAADHFLVGLPGLGTGTEGRLSLLAIDP
ncbi:MAG: hypothetical protein AW09_001005 [Candidatus Accumulibacter phosphatis]|uniref:Uncharacterized protein n=1 Tax=Candidatus Accumulibacter phosphatis TaxID=327160 RepID=A0A080LXU9_9PROT|nr:MAG: hypothetical protein AW09_001005 [Candidatus Accumulibacter phosphatis]